MAAIDPLRTFLLRSYPHPMHVTEQRLAAVRRRFSGDDGTLPVPRLKDLYNEAVHGILPLFDERLPEEYWKLFVRQHGFRPTGEQIFTASADWKLDWRSGEWSEFALVLAFVDRVPRLPERHQWVALSHPCAGVRIDWVSMIATELTPKAEVRSKLQEIVERWYHSDLCDPSLVMPEYRERAETRIAEYRQQLDGLGVTWTGSKPSPVEAIYPIDATQQALNALAVDPPQLWTLSGEAQTGSQAGPVILLLAPNSD